MSTNPPALSLDAQIKLELQVWLLDLIKKLHEITTSAKFYAWVTANAGALTLYLQGQITGPMLLTGLIVSALGYMGSKAYEDSHTLPPTTG